MPKFDGVGGTVSRLRANGEWQRKRSGDPYVGFAGAIKRARTSGELGAVVETGVKALAADYGVPQYLSDTVIEAGRSAHRWFSRKRKASGGIPGMIKMPKQRRVDDRPYTLNWLKNKGPVVPYVSRSGRVDPFGGGRDGALRRRAAVYAARNALSRYYKRPMRIGYRGKRRVYY